MKRLTDEQLIEMAKKTALAADIVQEIWAIGMKGMRLDSRGYRQICKAGQDLEGLYMQLRVLAEDRGIPDDFGRKCICAWN
ncbi:MAG: hypothetical protein K9K79_11260 [Desulfohalobiaceae bacterium]|nr:hypothetical protein [Desulfohalobiaceae bacterium]